MHPVFYNDCAGELESIMGRGRMCDALNELFAEKLQNKREETKAESMDDFERRVAHKENAAV